MKDLVKISKIVWENRFAVILTIFAVAIMFLLFKILPARVINFIVSILNVILCGFLLVITITSHVAQKKGDRGVVKNQIRNIGRDTIGRKISRWLVVIFALVGFVYGLTTTTFALLYMVVTSERLLVYRACRSNDDWLGRFLVKIDW